MITASLANIVKATLEFPLENSVVDKNIFLAGWQLYKNWD